MFEIKISKYLHFFGAVFRFVHTVAIQQELKKISVVDCRIRKASLDLEKKITSQVSHAIVGTRRKTKSKISLKINAGNLLRRTLCGQEISLKSKS